MFKLSFVKTKEINNIEKSVVQIFNLGLSSTKKIIRNIAADENNLYNDFKIFRYLGLLYIYKLLLRFSYYYPNTKFFFISKYVFIKTPTYFRKKFFKNNVDIDQYIIPPSIDDIFLKKIQVRKI